MFAATEDFVMVFGLETGIESLQKICFSSSEMPTVEKHGDKEKSAVSRVGEKGFIGRARVPRPSQKDYVVRPKSNVEGQFHEASKSRQHSRFDKAQREFKERNKQTKTMRAMRVSLEGRKMDI